MDNSNASDPTVNKLPPEVSLTDAISVTNEVFAEHYTVVDFIYHNLVNELKKVGFAHQIRAVDVADDYGLCREAVFDAAVFLARRGMINVSFNEVEELTCKCNACLCTRTYLSLRFNLDIDKQVVIERRQREQKLEEAQSRRREFFAKSSVGFVYLMQAGDRYKIGVSNNPQKRREQLNSGQSPFPVLLIHSVQGDGYEEFERSLHEKFGCSRVRGEWFVFDGDEVAAVIEAMNEWAAAQTATQQ